MSMPYNRTIQIRLSEYEKELITNRMREDGFHNLSAWARKTLMDADTGRRHTNAQIVHEIPCSTNAPDFDDTRSISATYGKKTQSGAIAAYYTEFSGESSFLSPKR
jgi:hypothetical protein